MCGDGESLTNERNISLLRYEFWIRRLKLTIKGVIIAGDATPREFDGTGNIGICGCF